LRADERNLQPVMETLDFLVNSNLEAGWHET